MAREQEPGGMDMLILHLLAERDMYGYEMVTELASRSNEVFQLKEGTLYPLLHRLEKEGRVRRYYHLTKRGGEKLRERTAAWETYSGAINAVLCGSPG